MAKKRFTPQFKEEACKMVMDRQYEVAVAAKELGVFETTLRYWLVKRGWQGPRQKDALPEEASNDPAFLKAKIRDLEQKLHRAETEREILKKATAYFAGQNP